MTHIPPRWGALLLGALAWICCGYPSATHPHIHDNTGPRHTTGDTDTPHPPDTPHSPPSSQTQHTVAPSPQTVLDDPVGAFITQQLAQTDASASEHDTDGSQSNTVTSRFVVSPNDEMTAQDYWKMSDQTCLTYLRKAGVVTRTPTFSTPFVRTPVLLESPIHGVAVVAKWPRVPPKHSVLDCRLAAALVPVCRAASAHGVIRIEYYSIWRPIVIPKDRCKSVRCQRQRKAVEAARRGTFSSMHGRALAIDIGWFTFFDDTIVSVQEDYERRLGAPPCQQSPQTTAGRFLQEFGCELHDKKLFNVILTPNGDKAHENHFHFDITPDASWFIIR